MADTKTAEPPSLDNPVLKPEYLDSAKSIFNEARKAEGLDKPISAKPDATEPEPAPESTPAKETSVSATPPAEAAAKPQGDNAAALPEDIFKPAEPELEKTNAVLADIEAMELP